MKSDRHKKILELIADNNIGTQEELADALNKAGYNVTQATVSRDIRALNLTKVTIDGVNQKYTTLSHSSPVPNDKYPWVEKGQVATTTRDNRDGIFLTECILMLNNTRLETITETYLKKSENNTVGNLLVTQAEVRDEIFENTLYGGSDWRYIYYFEPIDSHYVNTKLWQVSSSYNNRQPLLRISEMYLIAAECAGSKKAFERRKYHFTG